MTIVFPGYGEVTLAPGPDGATRVETRRHGGWWVPKGSLPAHLEEMQHQLPEGCPLGAHGAFIGRGNDGVVFGWVDKVVKVASVTGFHPANLIRSPEIAIQNGQRAAYLHYVLRSVPCVPAVQSYMIAGRHWIVKPYLYVPETYEDEQAMLPHAEEAIHQMHARGWAICDEVQMGQDPSGDWFLIDLGSARPLTRSRRKSDLDSLSFLRSRTGGRKSQEGPIDYTTLPTDLRDLSRWIVRAEGHSSNLLWSSESEETDARMEALGGLVDVGLARLMAQAPQPT